MCQNSAQAYGLRAVSGRITFCVGIFWHAYTFCWVLTHFDLPVRVRFNDAKTMRWSWVILFRLDSLFYWDGVRLFWLPFRQENTFRLWYVCLPALCRKMQGCRRAVLLPHPAQDLPDLSPSSSYWRSVCHRPCWLRIQEKSSHLKEKPAEILHIPSWNLRLTNTEGENREPWLGPSPCCLKVTQEKWFRRVMWSDRQWKRKVQGRVEGKVGVSATTEVLIQESKRVDRHDTPTTVKWRQSSQSHHHSTIGTRQTQYHEAL